MTRGSCVAARLRDRARLRQLNPHPSFLVEGGRHHEENQQHQQHVDEVDQIDLGVLATARTQVHEIRPLGGEIALRSSSASASFIASFSMWMTSRSTLPRR